MSETNYERYFGTLEKMASTLFDICDRTNACIKCAVMDDINKCPGVCSEREWLEWLESEAE